MKLSTRHAAKVAKLLALSQSENDAEALAATRKANKLLRSLGFGWPEALGVEPSPANSNEPEHWQQARETLDKGDGVLDDFERKFLAGICGFQELSIGQEGKLQSILLKVDLAGT